jgi:hypothetical protein
MKPGPWATSPARFADLIYEHLSAATVSGRSSGTLQITLGVLEREGPAFIHNDLNSCAYWEAELG